MATFIPKGDIVSLKESFLSYDRVGPGYEAQVLRLHGKLLPTDPLLLALIFSS